MFYYMSLYIYIINFQGYVKHIHYFKSKQPNCSHYDRKIHSLDKYLIKRTFIIINKTIHFMVKYLNGYQIIINIDTCLGIDRIKVLNKIICSSYSVE